MSGRARPGVHADEAIAAIDVGLQAAGDVSYGVSVPDGRWCWRCLDREADPESTAGICAPCREVLLADPAPDEPSPSRRGNGGSSGPTGDQRDDVIVVDPLSKVAAERDALAARLAAWPEVPDGHEVLVVPEWVSDEVAEWAGCNQLEGALADAGSAAVDRRPKPEPRVERVDALHAILNCLRVTNPDGPFSAVVAKWHEGCLVVADDATEVSRCQFIAPDGTVEVLVEDDES